MNERDLDRLIGALRDMPARRVDTEQRVWMAIAKQSALQEFSSLLNGTFGWKLSAGALALAVGAGFVTATMSPIAGAAKPTHALETWVTPGTAMAPSTILGG
jgi:hypothetical protein